jgi:hypothetical protein
MRINEKVITGMFKYHDDILFTENDFVVSPNNFLYVVIQETQGRNPDLGYPEYFVPYNSEERQNLASYEDFVNYINSVGNQSELGNKVLTLGLLSQILDTYLMGMDSSGKIRNKIFTDEIWFSNYLGDITKTSCDSNPLDILMENPEISHGYFVVEDKYILTNYLNISSEISDNLSEDATGILRQYTYDNEFGYTIRIQEIIEITTGTVLYRYAINTEGKEIFDKNKISTWRGYIKRIDIVDGTPVLAGDTDKHSDDNFHNMNAYQNVIGKTTEVLTHSGTAEVAL